MAGGVAAGPHEHARLRAWSRSQRRRSQGLRIRPTGHSEVGKLRLVLAAASIAR